MKSIVNLLGYDLIYFASEGNRITYSGNAYIKATVNTISNHCDSILDFDKGIELKVVNKRVISVDNIPQKESKKEVYIVPRNIKMMFPDRKDLISPTESVKNNEGKIIGCKSFLL